MSYNCVCRPSWPWTEKVPPASALWGLGLPPEKMLNILTAHILHTWCKLYFPFHLILSVLIALDSLNIILSQTVKNDSIYRNSNLLPLRCGKRIYCFRILWLSMFPLLFSQILYLLKNKTFSLFLILFHSLQIMITVILSSFPFYEMWFYNAALYCLSLFLIF